MRSPVLNINNACQTCQNTDEAELKARVELIQDRTKALMDRAEEAVVALIGDITQAKTDGLTDDQFKAAHDLQRKAQWRLDFIAAENSLGFPADQEAARILGEAIDYAPQGQTELAKLRRGIACVAYHEPGPIALRCVNAWRGGNRAESRPSFLRKGGMLLALARGAYRAPRASVIPKPDPCYSTRLGRYCSASAKCAGPIASTAPKSAIVRASLSTRW